MRKYTLDIVRAVAKKSGYSGVQVQDILYFLQREIEREVSLGNEVQLTGFGTFYEVETKDRERLLFGDMEKVKGHRKLRMRGSDLYEFYNPKDDA